MSKYVTFHKGAAIVHMSKTLAFTHPVEKGDLLYSAYQNNWFRYQRREDGRLDWDLIYLEQVPKEYRLALLLLGVP
jgi:hypothetical protein